MAHIYRLPLPSRQLQAEKEQVISNARAEVAKEVASTKAKIDADIAEAQAKAKADVDKQIAAALGALPLCCESGVDVEKFADMLEAYREASADAASWE